MQCSFLKDRHQPLDSNTSSSKLERWVGRPWEHVGSEKDDTVWENKHPSIVRGSSLWNCPPPLLSTVGERENRSRKTQFKTPQSTYRKHNQSFLQNTWHLHSLLPAIHNHHLNDWASCLTGLLASTLVLPSQLLSQSTNNVIFKNNQNIIHWLWTLLREWSRRSPSKPALHCLPLALSSRASSVPPARTPGVSWRLCTLSSRG